MKKKTCPLCGVTLDSDNDMRCSRFPICIYQEASSKVLDRYIMYDLETSGLSTERDHIIEFGAIYVEGGTIKDTFSALCNPEVFISQRISQITGITNEMLKKEKNESEVSKEFVQWVHNKDVDICVGHNIDNFDNRMLKTATKRFGLRYPFSRTLDTMKLAKSLKLKEKGIVENYKQETLANQYCGFEYEAHRALEDVEALFKVFQKLQSESNELPIMNINI